ncbi:unnamed protein product [Rotaria sp. Silwood2]|nr:unnamed protein product [Rotaria sp. Silwood2]CAF2929716.1 unnamed protein product [Rotaria sp. Silwood2]CAF3083027.1 unnamed protein product [Rotaria sp. Silwood2]CAF3150971.1 unnamed protein product [Rotaria sp. Silwood2]CAF4300900.1 unnamed protein product [Rotaria sp. Silwood2]
MTDKGYTHFKKFPISTSSSYSDQKEDFEKEKQNVVFEKIETLTIKPTDNNRHRHSGTFIKKLFNTTYNSKLINKRKRQSNSVDGNMFDENENNMEHILKVKSPPSMTHQPVLENDVCLTSAPNGEFKLKGILKNSKSNSGTSHLNDLYNIRSPFQYMQPYLPKFHKTNSKENRSGFESTINDNNSVRSKPNTSTPVKSVTFSDMICDMESKLKKSMPATIKKSCDQRENSQDSNLVNTSKVNSQDSNLVNTSKVNSQDSNLVNTSKVNSYEGNSIGKVHFYATHSLQLQSLTVRESRDSDSSDDYLVVF